MATKNFTKLVQDHTEKLEIQEKGELKGIEKQLLEEFSVKKVMKVTPTSKVKVNYAHDSDEVEKEIELGNKSTRKIRKMIQTHFMTGFAAV